MTRNFVSGFGLDLNGMIDLQVFLNHSENTYLERAYDFDRICVWKYPAADILTEPIVLNWLRYDY